jgi:DNA-binding GntR family transcriptional regulator
MSTLKARLSTIWLEWALDEDHPDGETADSFQNAPNVPLGVQIADYIREGILSARLRPGQPVTELQVAAELQVSRAPVREAIRILSQEGLLDMVPYKGTTVRGASRKDIEEIYSMREQLELFAVRRIVASPAPIDVGGLDESYARMRYHASANDLVALNAEDMHFHRVLIQMAGHDLLLEIWSMVAMRVRQIISLTNQQNRNLMQVARNHDPIIGALQRRDVEEACSILSRHIRSADEIVDA